MLLANVPLRYQEYWAQNAGASYVRTVPFPSQIGIVNGAASFNDGFPPLNFTPLGGVNPYGQDFNGILRALSQWDQWIQAGGPIVFDSTFAAAVGGYPKSAILPSVNWPGSFWLNTVDGNTTNPESGGSNWVGYTPLSLYTTDTGTANALVATLTVAPPSLARIVGLPIRIKKAGNANTGATTLNLNGLGAQNIITPDGVALIAGQLPANGIMTLVWDGANFQLQSVPSSQGLTKTDLQLQTGNYALDTGTANAVVITLSPVPASLASLTGAPIRITKANTTNTGAVTIAANGFTATTLLWADGTALSASQLPGSCTFSVIFDGTYFRLQSVVRPGLTAQDLQIQAGNYGVDTGTANQLVITLPTIPASTTALIGAPMRVKKGAATNTGGVTLAVNGLNPQAVSNPDGSDIVAGQLPPNGIFTAIYDGSRFMLQGASANYGASQAYWGDAAGDGNYPPLRAGYLIIPISLLGSVSQFYLQWSYTPEQTATEGSYGGGVSVTIDWPVSFPNAVMSAWFSTIWSSASSQPDDGNLMTLTGFTKTQFTMITVPISGSQPKTGRCMAYAIGY